MTREGADAFEYYDEPSQREPAAGEPRRRRARTLTRHPLVRFPSDRVEAVRPLAQRDNLAVSAWIRRAIDSTIRSGNVPSIVAYPRTWIASRAQMHPDANVVQHLCTLYECRVAASDAEARRRDDTQP